MKKDNLEEKEKHLKLEGTMKLLKNISSSSLINNGSFGNVYNRTNNKLLIKKQIAHHANGKLSLNTSTQKNK